MQNIAAWWKNSTRVIQFDQFIPDHLTSLRPLPHFLGLMPHTARQKYCLRVCGCNPATQQGKSQLLYGIARYFLLSVLNCHSGASNTTFWHQAVRQPISIHLLRKVPISPRRACNKMHLRNHKIKKGIFNTSTPEQSSASRGTRPQNSVVYVKSQHQDDYARHTFMLAFI